MNPCLSVSMSEAAKDNSLIFFSVLVILCLTLIALLIFHRYSQDVVRNTLDYQRMLLTPTPGVTKSVTTLDEDDKAINDLLNSVDSEIQSTSSSLNESPSPVQ